MRSGGFARSIVRAANAAICVAGLSVGAAHAQSQGNIALKSGESVELGPVYWIANCRSILIGLPEVEILEGPPGLTLNLKEAMVLPRRQNCPNKVSGGILSAAAAEVKDQTQGKLVYRIKYKTKDGDRQRSGTFNVSLFP
jgi:ribosomal protein L21